MLHLLLHRHRPLRRSIRNLKRRSFVNVSGSSLGVGCTSRIHTVGPLVDPCLNLRVLTPHVDITRTLQHKHELITKAKTQNALLETLNALDDAKRLSPVSDTVDVLAEPSAALPLWRRVDRRFWWNEWLSKPLIDAGVHYSAFLATADRNLTCYYSSIHTSFQLCKAFSRCRRSTLHGSQSHPRKATPYLWSISSSHVGREIVRVYVISVEALTMTRMWPTSSRPRPL